MPKPFGPSLCKACSTHEVLLCTLPPKQKGSSSSTNRPWRPSAPPEFDPADEPPPYPPPHQPSPSPSSNSPPGPETSLDSPSTPATRSPTQYMFPLREVAGPEGPTRVHVPFSLSDMSQIEEKLGSFSENPTRYRKEFLRLSQAYKLTWSDLYYILHAISHPR